MDMNEILVFLIIFHKSVITFIFLLSYIEAIKKQI
jgi:hypothetical protein